MATSGVLAARQEFERTAPVQVSEDDSGDDSQNGDEPEGRFVSRTLKKKRTESGLHAWRVEVLTCSVAIVALAAIIITLVVRQRRPLPQWPHLISINALISIFN